MVVSSQGAIRGMPAISAYSASKGGVVGMTLPAARDLARHGIRVLTIAPGTFDTPMLAGLPDEAREALAAFGDGALFIATSGSGFGSGSWSYCDEETSRRVGSAPDCGE